MAVAPDDHIVHDPAEQPRWDAARTMLLARSLGDLDRLGATDIDALHDRYQNACGKS